MSDEGDLKQSSCCEVENQLSLQHGTDNKKTRYINRTEASDDVEGQGIEPTDSSIQTTSDDMDAGSTTHLPNTVPTVENPFDKANRYLYNHNLFPLFQELVMNVAYKQPSDSISFMVSEIEKYRDQL